METIKGIASNVRNTVSISGGGNDSQITTTHIAVFQIEGRQVKAKSGEPLLINEGDSVIAVGSISSGVFNALAYKNLTTLTEGNEGWVMMLVFGVVFPCVAVFAFATFSSPFFGIMPRIVSGAFFAFGMFALFRGGRVMKAISILRQQRI